MYFVARQFTQIHYQHLVCIRHSSSVGASARTEKDTKAPSNGTSLLAGEIAGKQDNEDTFSVSQRLMLRHKQRQAGAWEGSELRGG